jgi:hypothetical protein
MTPSPYTSTSWRCISAGRMFLAFKYRITKQTSEMAGLVIDTVLYRALWHNNQFTQWLGKYWGHGRGSVDSSRLSKTSSQWPARAGCANGSYFKNDLRTRYMQNRHINFIPLKGLHHTKLQYSTLNAAGVVLNTVVCVTPILVLFRAG